MPDYAWKQIKPLSFAEREIDLGDMASLYQSWKDAKQNIQQAGQSGLSNFRQQLVRRLSVETGILERLYDLDRGTTEALVLHGFAEDLITRSNTTIDPSALVDILRDHEAATQLVVDCVAGNRKLSKGLIHELHAILTRNQGTTSARDQFGNRMEIPLLKGKYKQQPNNPKRPDNSVHEYCPPLQVDSEMEQLLDWLATYELYNPVVVASWLHHRFSQIHPYQDGNGRVARALTTMVLLQADLLPLIVDRDLRLTYIEALEHADQGDLSRLTNMFARLEKTTLLQALSIEPGQQTSKGESLTASVIDSLADKLQNRREQHELHRSQLRKVNAVAQALRQRSDNFLTASLNQLSLAIPELRVSEINIQPGGTDYDNANWFKTEITQSAREMKKLANFFENHYFSAGSIAASRQQLDLVVSFHHIGAELTGVMEATAFAKLRQEGSAEILIMSTTDPFIFTHRTITADIVPSFDRWLDAAIAAGLKEFADRL